MWLNQKKLYEHDPRSLGFETLSSLQSALIGRLVLINTELKSRLEGPEGNPNHSAGFHSSAEQLDGFNVLLDHLLVGATKKSPVHRKPSMETRI